MSRFVTAAFPRIDTAEPLVAVVMAPRPVSYPEETGPGDGRSDQRAVEATAQLGEGLGQEPGHVHL
ncbi:hypothetical protein GCM10010437_089840 [Actinoplanes palleronii]